MIGRLVRETSPAEPAAAVEPLTWPLPLSMTWPLVVTSLAWIGVWRFAGAASAKAGGADPVLVTLTYTVLLTLCVSAAHWLTSRNGILNLLDRVMARSSLVIYTAVAIARVRDPRIHVLGWPLWVTMLACYYRSTVLGPVRDPPAGLTEAEAAAKRAGRPAVLIEPWVMFHVGFHICVGVGQCMIIAGASSADAERRWI